MDEKLVSRLMRLARVASFAMASAGMGLREEICKSEPSSVFAWVAMPDCTLALREWIATSAAMPETRAREKMARRWRCARLSRHAMRHVHEYRSAAQRLWGRAAAERGATALPAVSRRG